MLFHIGMLPQFLLILLIIRNQARIGPFLIILIHPVYALRIRLSFAFTAQLILFRHHFFLEFHLFFLLVSPLRATPFNACVTALITPTRCHSLCAQRCPLGASSVSDHYQTTPHTTSAQPVVDTFYCCFLTQLCFCFFLCLYVDASVCLYV